MNECSLPLTPHVTLHCHTMRGRNQIPITFALKLKFSASDICKCVNAEDLFAANAKWDVNESTQEDKPSMDCTANCTARLSQLHANIQKTLCQTKDNMEAFVPALDSHSTPCELHCTSDILTHHLTPKCSPVTLLSLQLRHFDHLQPPQKNRRLDSSHAKDIGCV